MRAGRGLGVRGLAMGACVIGAGLATGAHVRAAAGLETPGPRMIWFDGELNPVRVELRGADLRVRGTGGDGNDGRDGRAVEGTIRVIVRGEGEGDGAGDGAGAGGGGGGVERLVPVSDVSLLADEAWWNAAVESAERAAGRGWWGAIGGAAAGGVGEAGTVEPGAMGSAAGRAGLGVLELVDGRRLVGEPEVAGARAEEEAGADADDIIRWRDAVLGVVAVRLEDVASITFPRAMSGSGETVAAAWRGEDGGELRGAGRAGDDQTRTREVEFDEPAAGGVGVGLGGGGAVVARRDRVELRNGDVLEGFVEGVGSVVSVRVEGGGGRGEVVEAPVERVRRVVLVNPATAVGDRRGARLWLDSGSVLGARRVWSGGVGGAGGAAGAQAGGAMGGAGLMIEGLGGEGAAAAGGAGGVGGVGLELLRVRGLMPRGDAVAALGAGGVERVEEADGGGGGRVFSEGARWRVDRDAPAEAGELVLPGPMSVEVLLPAGARAVAGVAVLPSSSRAWGDAELVFERVGAGGAGEVGGSGEAGGAGGVPRGATELWRGRLHAGEPVRLVRFLVPRGVSRVRVRLEEGAHGPAQDRVVLTRMMVATGGGRD